MNTLKRMEMAIKPPEQIRTVSVYINRGNQGICQQWFEATRESSGRYSIAKCCESTCYVDPNVWTYPWESSPVRDNQHTTRAKAIIAVSEIYSGTRGSGLKTFSLSEVVEELFVREKLLLDNRPEDSWYGDAPSNHVANYI